MTQKKRTKRDPARDDPREEPKNQEQISQKPVGIVSDGPKGGLDIKGHPIRALTAKEKQTLQSLVVVNEGIDIDFDTELIESEADCRLQ